MAVEFGYSNRGKPTVIYRNFEYVKDCDNVCGTTSWRCRLYQRMKCKARLVTAGSRVVVGNRQPDHSHSGNVATALARKAVGEMKQTVGTMNVTVRSAQASVSAALSDDVLMALPKRTTLTRALQRQRHKVTQAASIN